MRITYGFKETSCCVLTMPGLLKVLETFMAGFIFICIINTSLYLHQPALEWCVAVYSICFIPAALAILLNLGKWQCRLPSLYPIFQLVLSLLSVLLYVSALVLWPLYQFNEQFGRQPHRSSDMGRINGLNYDMCFWDQRLAVTLLTAINLLVYASDLVYWARQVSVGTEDQPRVPDPSAHRRYTHRALSAPDVLFLALLSPCSRTYSLISLSFPFPSLLLCLLSVLCGCPHSVLLLSLASFIFSTFFYLSPLSWSSLLFSFPVS
ncbi:myeloid-associated differentiation marker [Bos taurus]|uniref:myeloid-associated differentiation marker n=1 Tax=Bos taurus TaxID=9913 RepID=UPI000D53A78D|nr:myeloid-associated differentiation marker [Bos taurus]